MGVYEEMAQSLTEEQKNEYNELWNESLDKLRERARKEADLTMRLALAPRFRENPVASMTSLVAKMEDWEAIDLLRVFIRSLQYPERA